MVVMLYLTVLSIHLYVFLASRLAIYIFHIWNIEQLAQVEGVTFTLVYDITSPGLEPVGAGLDA